MTTPSTAPVRPPGGDFIHAAPARLDARGVAELEIENLRLQGLVAELLFTNQKLRTALEGRDLWNISPDGVEGGTATRNDPNHTTEPQGSGEML